MSVAAPQPCIVVSDVSFSYGSSSVLEHISFSVPQGDYLGIIGPNGGGKSTLLKIILGILRPSQGTVQLFDRAGKPLAPSRIGYVPQRISQDTAEFPASVEEVVWSGWLNRNRAAGRAAVERALVLAEIEPLRSRLLRTLSGGERQRVFIARALVNSPELLVLDEPTVGVDVAARETVYQFLQRLNRELGSTIIIVSHDTDIVAEQVTTALCVNRTLICHAQACDLAKTGALEKMYGKDMKVVVHHYEHDHAH